MIFMISETRCASEVFAAAPIGAHSPVAASYILLHQKATAHTILKTFAGPYTARRDLSKNATKLFSTP